MIIMMSAPCTQEVGRSARNLGNPRMDRFTSPGGCTCAITGRMHAVCDEHGSHSFKTDGLPAHRPWMHEVMSTRRQKISGQNSEATNIWMHVVFFHAHGVGSVHAVCLVLLDPSCQTDDANLILRIANGPNRNYPRWWQRMEMHTQHVYISVQLLASFLHFTIDSVSALMVSAVQIQMIDFLNEGWSLYRDNVPVFSYMKNGDRLSCISGNKRSNWRGFRLRDVLNDETQNAKLNSKKTPDRCEN